jgi:hypothetical protein
MTLPHLARRPLPAFPLAWDKRPATPHGWKDATVDPAEFADLMGAFPGPLIGVPTGEASGLDVLDVDPQGLGWLRQHERELPPTRVHRTRRGLHLLFRHHDGLRNSAGKIAPGVDVRADGGYVVWWPAAGLRISNHDVLAPWPAWLLREIGSERRIGTAPISPYLSDDVGAMRAALAAHPRIVSPASKEASYATAALNNGFSNVASRRPPGRGGMVEREAYKIGGLAGAGCISAADVFEMLMLACEENGLVRKDGRWLVERAILRSLLNGIARPRHPTLE